MSTSSVGLTGTTNSNGSTLFNGTSRFSADFQNVIQQDVALASLPYQQIAQEVSGLQSQSSELGTLGTDFNNLQSTVQQLETATTSGLLAASTSDNTVAQPSISSGASAGTYTLTVSSIGSATTTISQAGDTAVTDPSSQSISSSSSFTLTVNGTATTITPSSDTLDSLVSAINSESSSLGVEASIVNLGTSSSPDYRLSLQSTELGPDTVQINDGNSDLLTNVSPGAYTTYQVDGSDYINSTSNTISLAPGLTVNLNGPNEVGASTTITVAPNTNSIQSALSNFVNSYNSVYGELQNNVGKSGGALQGNSLVYQLTNALQNLGGYASGSGGLNSLASLGVTYNKDGTLSFDSSTFSSATLNQIQDLTSFLGDTSSGGFLQYANNTLSGITDSSTGLIPNATSSLQSQITNDETQISNGEQKVNTLQTNLTQQLAASDALVASLEQNYNLVSGLFQAEQNNVTAQSLG